MTSDRHRLPLRDIQQLPKPILRYNGRHLDHGQPFLANIPIIAIIATFCSSCSFYTLPPTPYPLLPSKTVNPPAPTPK